MNQISIQTSKPSIRFNFNICYVLFEELEITFLGSCILGITLYYFISGSEPYFIVIVMMMAYFLQIPANLETCSADGSFVFELSLTNIK